MRGHNPVGWATTLLIAVACAHVLLELAAAVLAIAVAMRLLVSPTRELLRRRDRRQLGRRGWPLAPVIERRRDAESDREASGPPSR